MPATLRRLRRLFRWMIQRPLRSLAFFALAGFLALNLLAFQHARAMLNYQAGAARTPPPHSFSLSQKVKILAWGVSIPRPTNESLLQDSHPPLQKIRIATDDSLTLEASLLLPPHSQGTVLLFHGYSASRSSLLAEARAFHELGFAALLVDFRGSGGSDGFTTTLGYHEALDVAAATRHAQRLDLPRPIILYGQSMGGAAILRSISKLGVQPDAIALESVFDRLLSATRNRFALMGVPSFPSAELLLFWGSVQAGFSGFEHNPVEYACACQCDALVLHGAEDRHARLCEGQAIYEGLAGYKKFVAFDGAGHASLYAADPQRWRAAIGPFLSRQVEKTRSVGVAQAPPPATREFDHTSKTCPHEGKNSGRELHPHLARKGRAFYT